VGGAEERKEGALAAREARRTGRAQGCEEEEGGCWLGRGREREGEGQVC
jgi:hypothetical protein